jgi:hypothetical protein
MLQGFLEHLISNRGLTTVDRSKGRFSSFLLASFQNFMAADIRRARAGKRGGRAELIRLDWRDAEARLAFEPEDRRTPENALRRTVQARARFEPFSGLGSLPGVVMVLARMSYSSSNADTGEAKSEVHRLA